jgi:hypothetical protein
MNKNQKNDKFAYLQKFWYFLIIFFNFYLKINEATHITIKIIKNHIKRLQVVINKKFVSFDKLSNKIG